MHYLKATFHTRLTTNSKTKKSLSGNNSFQTTLHKQELLRQLKFWVCKTMQNVCLSVSAVAIRTIPIHAPVPHLHAAILNYLAQNHKDTLHILRRINPLTPNDDYSGRTAPLTSKRCILYIYSTNTGTEYFKHGIYSPFFSSSKCSLFHKFKIVGSCIIHILYRGCAKIKKIILAPKG